MQNQDGGGVGGGVRWLLRLEGLMLLTAAGLLYARIGGDWKTFALLFLLPDLSFAGYLAGPRIGALAYNAAHSTIGPITWTGLALTTGHEPALPLIWFAHVGFDRAMGYGLKYARGFGDTHLGHIGWRRARRTEGA